VWGLVSFVGLTSFDFLLCTAESWYDYRMYFVSLLSGVIVLPIVWCWKTFFIYFI
jgi:hypothetical protein